MNRARQIASVYRELRGAVGPEIPAREVLACAASLVELFGGSLDAPAFELHTGGLPFDGWATDTALSDGGWRVLARQTPFFGDYDIGDEDESLDRAVRETKWRYFS